MAISKIKRFKVYARDGNRCKKCKSERDLTVDHIIPLIAGGTSAMYNLQTLCKDCNSNKGCDYKLSFFQRLRNVWNLHLILVDDRTRTKGEWTASIAALENRVKNDHTINLQWTNDLLGRNKEVVKRLDDQQRVIVDIMEAMGLEYRISKSKGPYITKQ